MTRDRRPERALNGAVQFPDRQITGQKPESLAETLRRRDLDSARIARALSLAELVWEFVGDRTGLDDFSPDKVASSQGSKISNSRRFILVA
ncbi:MAG: hypothetical protein ACI8UO_002448 [Verrucomicrobiales bacterium]|jgi:hypothetical protein